MPSVKCLPSHLVQLDTHGVQRTTIVIFTSTGTYTPLHMTYVE